MNDATKRLVGAALTVTWVPVVAQPTTPASAPSQPTGGGDLKFPVDPTWLVIALVVGAVLGYLIGVARGRNAAAH